MMTPTFLVHDSEREIAPLASATIQVRPQREPLTPRRLRIDPDVALDFRLDDVLVGNRSQLPLAQSIPCTHFMHGPGLDTSQLPYIAVYEAALAYARATRAPMTTEGEARVRETAATLRYVTESAEIQTRRMYVGDLEPEGRPFACETIWTCMDFTIYVTNLSERPRRFVATWECTPPDFEAERQDLLRHGRNIAAAWGLTTRALEIVGTPPSTSETAPGIERTPPRARDVERIDRDPPGFGWNPHDDD